MFFRWGSIIPFLLVVLGTTTVWSQDPGPTTGPQSDPFTEFQALDDNVDKFNRDTEDYLIVDDKADFRQAHFACREYGASIAIIETVDLATFIAEALSETRLELDTLWVAGKRNKDNETAPWYWEKTSDKTTPVLTPEVLELFIKPDLMAVQATDRDCLTFGRSYHEKPEFRPLTCQAKRGYICQRPRGIKIDNSTHPGWIKIRKRLYKIYAEEVTYNMGDNICARHDPDATLAVVDSFDDAQKLGRYLLIGRPSLENAWIGARWISGQYRFEAENLNLENTTSGTDNYPPWRNNEMKKPFGCLLLDRHLANTTLFVEARCTRLRAIICYKIFANESSVNFTDVIIGPDGYRLIFNKLPWKEARDFCKIKYEKFSSKLVEITEAKHVPNLLYVMGENRTAVQHLWVGGRFHDDSWIWDSQSTPVDKNILDWVTNDTYSDEAEAANTCLDMDRENHIKALHYGANCEYPQSFVCHFASTDLEQLEAEEQDALRKKI